MHYGRLSTLILLTCLLTLSGQVHAIKLKIATLSPEGSFWMNQMRSGADEIEKRTEGRVKFKFYPGGVMGKDKTVLRKMRVGQLHGAALTNGSLNKHYKDIQIYNLIMLFDSYDEVDYARSKMDKTILDGLESSGLVPIGVAEMGFAYLMSTEKIATTEDLRKYKAWVPENNYVAQTAIEAFGVAPIPLPVRDVLVGLQTRMVEVVAGIPVGALALQWHTQVKHVLDMPLLYIYGGLVITDKYFKRISKADQKIVREVMAGVVERVEAQGRKDNEAALKAMRDLGIQFNVPTDAEKAKLRALIKNANDTMVERGNLTRGSINRVESLVHEYRRANKK